jgi:DNA-binding transcriptional LysR family regulator
MDTIASMRAFAAVAKTGSFSAAAQKLDLVPSVITSASRSSSRWWARRYFVSPLDLFLRSGSRQNVYLLPQRHKIQPRALPATETDLRPSKQ